MNSTILTPLVSTPIPTAVVDLETLQAEARHLNLIPIFPNICRVQRAFDLVENHCVRLVDRFGKVRIYEVSSQARDLVHSWSPMAITAAHARMLAAVPISPAASIQSLLASTRNG